MCVLVQAYFDLETSLLGDATLKLIGQSLLSSTTAGLNMAVLSKRDLAIKATAAYASSSSSILTTIEQHATVGDFLFVVTQGNASGLATDTLSYLEDNFAASSSLGSLAAGQQYVLVAKMGSGTAFVEVFSEYNATTAQWGDLQERVCVSELLSCADDGSTEVLVSTSGGEVTLGYAASIMIGTNYLTTSVSGSGLYAVVIDRFLSVKISVEKLTDAESFMQWFQNASFNTSDYIVLTVNTDASSILQNSTVRASLSVFPYTKQYISGSGYVLAARQEDSTAIFEHLSNSTVVISAACVSTHTFAPTAAPSYAPTLAPTFAPSPSPSAAPSVAPTSASASAISASKSSSSSTKSWPSTPTGIAVITVMSVVFVVLVVTTAIFGVRYWMRASTTDKVVSTNASATLSANSTAPVGASAVAAASTVDSAASAACDATTTAADTDAAGSV
jgi:hypothetical protein